MGGSLEVEFWGTRGSLPSPGASTARYGGNTSCVEVRAAGHTLVFDAGTGIRELGRSLLERGVTEVHLFLSHYHWDHIMGFPFFGPIFRPDARIHLYGEEKEELSVGGILAGQMRHPYFPVPWVGLSATIDETTIEPGATIDLPGVSVSSCRLNHPQHSVAYRVDVDDKSVVYATDIEHGSVLDAPFQEFIRGADLLIMDCSYTDAEYPDHVGWGHATWQAAVDFADAAGIGQLAIFHHLPERTDPEVDAIVAAARELRPATFGAREGQVVRI